MIDSHDQIAVFLGLDVGKGEQHAVALDRTDKRLLDRAMPNDEAPTAADSAPTRRARPSAAGSRPARHDRLDKD